MTQKIRKPPNNSFEHLLTEKFLLLDGAIGTQLYREGILLHRSFEEQNKVNPDLVCRVHRDYIASGADILTTNTFSANRFRLAHFGLEGEVGPINRAGLALLRGELCQAYPDEYLKGAQRRHLVAASVGPCLTPVELWQEHQKPAIEAAFAEQLEALCLATDIEPPEIVLAETFSHGQELESLLKAYQQLYKVNTPIPALVLGLTVSEQGLSASGFAWNDFVQRFWPLR